jgi:SAM-dependent methyltransferase
MYNRYWGGFPARVASALDSLLLHDLADGAHILDLCCGTGQLPRLLVERGYRVTGIDGSEEMLRYARKNAPRATFIAADARAFELPERCDAAISTYDSLNHVMSLDELSAVFRHVYAALNSGGCFVFDLNMEGGFKARWRGSFGIAEDDHALIARTSYRPEEQVGQVDLTMFFLEDERWRRVDLTLTQHCYGEDEVRGALESAGLTDIVTRDAANDLDIPEEAGRMFFVACKPQATV